MGQGTILIAVHKGCVSKCSSHLNLSSSSWLQIGGYMSMWEGLTFATIRGAGRKLLALCYRLIQRNAKLSTALST